jgi:hypothetical protein
MSIRRVPSGFPASWSGRGAHEGRDIVQMKVLSDRRGEGGGIAWLVRYSVHGHVGRPEYPHAVVASRIPSLVSSSGS